MQLTGDTPPKWWRETEVLLVVALVCALFLPQLTALNVRGEETRRALVATEMIRTGDWVVPRQQGELYFSRPPMGSWFIALVGLVRGQVDVAAIRLPSVMAVLLTSVLLYAAARNFLSRTGALAAAIAYPTMFQVLEIGRLGESEGVFSFFVSAALLLWQWGESRGWSQAITWVAAYSMAACAGLTKGLQGPVYFVLPVVCYLLLSRRWRDLFRVSHLAGFAAMIAIIACWQIPYMARAGQEAGMSIWIGQVTDHLTGIEWQALWKHIAYFPFEILVCTLPWSPILVQLFSRNFRESLRRSGAPLLFFVVCLLATFPSVWFTPHARARYFMPLFPILAMLCGTVVEYCTRATEVSWMNRGWRQYLSGAALIIVTLGVAVAFSPIVNRPWAYDMNDSLMTGAIFLVISLAVAVTLVNSAIGDIFRSARRCVVALAAYSGMAYCLIAVGGIVRNQPDIRYRTAKVLARVPDEAQLVSLGRINHAFAYYYGEPIPALPWPTATDVEQVSYENDVEYFCFQRLGRRDEEIFFEWERLGELNIANTNSPYPQDAVVFGRRLRITPLAAQQPPATHQR